MAYQSMKLVDNLYCYIWKGRGNNCNVSLFTNVLRGERPHIIIDPGILVSEFGEPCFDLLLRSMESDGFHAEDIGLIIITHAHLDHFQATEAIIEKSREKDSNGIAQTLVALSREEEEYLRTVGEKQYSTFGVKLPQFEPFFYLDEGDLNIGKERKLTLHILKTPGHSPGSISIYWPENKVLITGDVIFYGGMGRTDLPGGSMVVLKQSIEKLSKLDVEYLIAGHSTEYGGIIKGKDNVMHNFQAIKLLI
jgi:glyoxylase-like metal-dependent hydrolase (beta-lactamase superfamily II)